MYCKQAELRHSLSVITSLYGFGVILPEQILHVLMLSVFLLFGLVGACCENKKPVGARPMVDNRIVSSFNILKIESQDKPKAKVCFQNFVTRWRND
jgi:hypothetical protein